MITDIDKEARIAAAWWTDVLRRGAKHDDGDYDLGVIGLRALALQYVPRPDEETLLQFETMLAEAIQEDHATAVTKTAIVRSDYSPMGLLQKVAGACSIDAMLFPEKTIMWVGPGRVIVRYGYGAKKEFLYCQVVKFWDLFHELDTIEHHDWHMQHGRKEESNPIGMPEFLTIEKAEERIGRLERECRDYKGYIESSVTALLRWQNEDETLAQRGSDTFNDAQNDLKILQGNLMFKEELLQRLKEEVAKLRGEL